MAAPHVAGAVALLLAQGLTPQQAVAELGGLPGATVQVQDFLDGEVTLEPVDNLRLDAREHGVGDLVRDAVEGGGGPDGHGPEVSRERARAPVGSGLSALATPRSTSISTTASVETKGLEPSTSGLQSRCSPSSPTMSSCGVGDDLSASRGKRTP